jgi:cell division protein FtsI/penicillin-binding protein 2
VARWTAGVATGCLVAPRLALATETDSGSDAFIALSGPAPQPLPFADKLAPVRAGMKEAAQHGTAALLSRILPGAGGKTGSAEDPASPGGRADSWFTAAAPVSNPSLVITAFVRGGGHGASTAGPVVGRTLAYFVAHHARVMAASSTREAEGEASDGECLQHPGLP